MQTDLVNGIIGIKEIELNSDAINAILKELSLNIRIIDSYIGNISANIPWKELNKSSCIVKVCDLQITVNTRGGFMNRAGNMSAQELVTSMMESMISSKELASNVMSDDGEGTSSTNILSEDSQGKDTIAGIIELMMSRVQIIFENTIIRIETDEDINETGIKTALEIEIERMEFLDQLLEEARVKSGVSDDTVIKLDSEGLFNSPEIKKLFKITNAKIYTDIFTNETPPTETIESYNDSVTSSNQELFSSAMGSFHSTDSMEQSSNFKSIYQTGDILKCDSEIRKIPITREKIKSRPILVAAISGKNNLMRLNLHNFGSAPRTDQSFNKKVDISLCLKNVKFFSTPTQLTILKKLATLVSTGDYQNKNLENKSFDNYNDPDAPAVRRLASDDAPLIEQGLNDCIEDDRISMTSEHFSFGHRKFHLSNIISEEFVETTKQQISIDMNKHVSNSKKNTTRNRASSEMEDSFSDTITRHGSTTTLTEKKPDYILLKVDIHNLQSIVTHKDPLSLQSTKGESFESIDSAIELIAGWSDNYFKSSENVKFNLSSRMKDVRHKFNDLYKDDHIRFVAATIVLNMFCEKQSELDQTTLKLSMFNCDLIEYLTSSSQVDKDTDTTISLLNFDDCIATGNEPQVIIECRITPEHKSIDIGLLPCKIEFDLSIIDRLSNLICNEPFYNVNYDEFQHGTSFSGCIITDDKKALFEPSDLSQQGGFISATLKCNHLCLDFRFPKADLRDLDCKTRNSYYIRQIYDDYLRLDLSYINIELPKLSFQEISEHFGLHISCTTILGTLMGDLNTLECKEEDRKFLYGYSGKEEEKILLTFNYDLRNKSLQMTSKEHNTSKIEDSEGEFFNLSYTMEGPFSHRKSLSNNELMVMPGDRHELYEFSKKSCENATINISIFFPSLKILFPSRKFYEILYNRFGNDVALWEPSASCYKKTHTFDESCDIESSKDNFQPCRNAQGEYVNNSDDNNGHDNSLGKKKTRVIEVEPHMVSVVLTAKHANILICHNNDIIMDGIVTSSFPSDIVLNVTDFRFFYVHGYYGKPNIDYSYITTTVAKIYHLNNCNGNDEFERNITDLMFACNDKMDKLIKFEPINENEKLCPFLDNDSFTLSMKLQMDTPTSRKIILAVGLRNSTLHLEPLVDPLYFWINQLIDFFTVEDYCVPGYVLPNTTIELHSNIESVVIAHDQRNIVQNSPYELRFVINSCNIQSKIIQNVDVLQFNCTLEDSSLFMRSRQKSNLDFDPNEYIYKGTNISQILNEFAKILSCGHLKLQIALSTLPENSKKLKTPLLSVICSNDNLNIWVCSDTFYIFLNIITEIVDFKRANDIEKKEREENMAKNVTAEELDKLLNASGSNYNNFSLNNFSNNQSEIIDKNSFSSEEKSKKPSASIQDMISDAIDFDAPSEKNSCEKSESSDSDNCSTAFMHEYKNKRSAYSSDDDFCDLTDDIGSGITDKSGEAKIRHLAFLNDGSPIPIEIVEDYFGGPILESMSDPTSLASFNSHVLSEFIIEKMSISIYLYGGSDFGGYSTTNKSYSSWKTKRDHSTCFKEGSIGGPYRDHTVCIGFCLDKISFTAKMFNEHNSLNSMINLSIRDIFIQDHLVISEIDTMLHKNITSGSKTQIEQPFVTFKMVENHIHEAKVRMSVVPMKLNIDQDTLNFIIDFLTETMENVKVVKSIEKEEIDAPTLDIPVIENEGKSNTNVKQMKKLNPDEPLVQISDPMTLSVYGEDIENKNDGCKINLGEEMFIKNFTFTPECNIKIDYNNKRLLSSTGSALNIAMGLASLKGAEISLKEIKNKNGVLGLGRCMTQASSEWYNDIYNNQLTKIIKGYGPTSPIINMFQGIRDLVALPVEEIYKTDGHIVKGIKSGASSFSVSAATAMVEIGQSLSHVVQSVAEFAFDIVHPEHINPRDIQRTKVPGNLREGIHHAYDIIKNDMQYTARHIKSATTQHAYENNGTVLALARTAAPVLLQPVICSAKATKAILDGVRSELQPEEFFEDQKKWKNQNK
uniref:Autophagy-related protein 2 n=1 Tax=Parastrongyloides trichosuri TaxID=131310 RepID=A0A0N4ZB36_PARTI